MSSRGQGHTEGPHDVPLLMLPSLQQAAADNVLHGVEWAAVQAASEALTLAQAAVDGLLVSTQYIAWQAATAVSAAISCLLVPWLHFCDHSFLLQPSGCCFGRVCPLFFSHATHLPQHWTDIEWCQGGCRRRCAVC